MKDSFPMISSLRLRRIKRFVPGPFPNHSLPTFLLMLSVISFIACKSMENRPVKIPEGFDWQGHRGCRGLMPENSIPAFVKAISFPEVKTLELDLAVSKDNDLIVSHEPWFNPEICLLPNGDTIKKKDEEKFMIYRMGLKAIRGFDCGTKFNPKFPDQEKMKVTKPTLEEAYSAVTPNRPDIRWNMEIKSQPDWDGIRHPPIEEFVSLTVKEIRRLGIEKQVTVQSFDTRALEATHRQAPELPTAFLIENANSFDSNMARLTFTPSIYSPYYLLVTKQLVKQCHDRNIKLIPWTVNDVKSMRRLIRLGVDGIITDYPNKIQEVGK